MILETAIGVLLATTAMTAVAEPDDTRAERFRILWALGDRAEAIKALVEGMDSKEILNVLRQIDGYGDGDPVMLGKFVRDYAVAALWSTNDESTPSGGVPMDQNYDLDDIAPETWLHMILDCLRFRTENEAMIRAVLEGGMSDEGQLGHDFWLTRNGHGVGFNDRGYEDRQKGEELHKAATKFREFGLYVGDDGKIYH